MSRHRQNRENHPAKRGDVSHFIQVRSTLFCFRIRDPSIRLGFVSGRYVSRPVYEPFGSYANQGGSYTTRA
jgi:hypothetical protein